MFLLAGHGLFAQGPMTVSVSAKTGQGCGAGLTAASVQQDLEGRVRAAGLALAKVHTATLAADVDCTAAGARSMAIHQCLSLSQVVPVASHANGMTLATTWRQCLSYKCAAGKCEALSQTVQEGLVDAFVGALPELNARHSMAAPDAPRIELPRGPARTAPVTADAGLLKGIPNLRVSFFLLYIVTCLAVLARWEFARQYRQG